jgi:tetratricopeptide (TPR) repeat protein
MERGFEAQPSNAAIQGELQRLYARRDGVAPPRIRMTRGALAQMYVQGELYPQAISEIKSVLKEDPGRRDMQSLLARALFRSGQKNEAAEVASSLLRMYPYSFDANRVLVEILGGDRPESVQIYRQRVIELDPYAAHVSGSILQINDAPDSAVAVEHLDWNGQAVGSDWRSKEGLSLESGSTRDGEPSWLAGGLDESKEPPLSAPTPFDQTQGKAVPAFDTSAQADDNIPEFLRQAGWGQSTGAFDESKASFAEDVTLPPTQAAPLAEGDMPDWVKAMAPAEALKPAEQDEELPDWINKIGTGVLASSTDSASDQPSSFAESSDDQPDWMKQLGQADAPASSASMADDTPDWLKPDTSAQPASFDESSKEQPDWLRGPGEPEQAAESPALSSNDFDFLDELKSTAETGMPAMNFDEPASQPSATPAASDLGSLGSTEKEVDDSFAWLESLAAKQGASEGLLIKPEDRLEQEPDWVKQAKSLTGELGSSAVESTPQETPARTTGKLEELGKSEQERDDSFSWLESLAAKQGASEGLLIKPEDRLDAMPDWVNQVKEIGESQPAAQEPAAMDTGTWLKSLDEEESKSVPSSDETGIWLKGLEEPPSKPEPVHDDTATWLKSLDDSSAKPEPVVESSNDETAMWLKNLDEPEAASVAADSQASDLPDWMQSIEDEKKESEAGNVFGAESDVPAKARTDDQREGRSEAEVSSELQGSFDQPVARGTPKTDTGSLPSWLRGLDKEEKQTPQDDLPAWLRDGTGELVAEPTKIEPTRSDDWQPMETQVEPLAVEEKPVERLEQKPEEKPQPAPKPVARKAVEPRKSEPRPATPVSTYQEPVTRKGTGMLTQTVDMVLGQARNELNRSNIPGALETYAKLIKKGRYLDEVIFDLREALYRYPVEVSIWQSLGDAYMRANRLQDALDSYTKAEELLR